MCGGQGWLGPAVEGGSQGGVPPPLPLTGREGGVGGCLHAVGGRQRRRPCAGRGRGGRGRSGHRTLPPPPPGPDAQAQRPKAAGEAGTGLLPLPLVAVALLPPVAARFPPLVREFLGNLAPDELLQVCAQESQGRDVTDVGSISEKRKERDCCSCWSRGGTAKTKGVSTKSHVHTPARGFRGHSFRTTRPQGTHSASPS